MRVDQIRVETDRLLIRRSGFREIALPSEREPQAAVRARGARLEGNRFAVPETPGLGVEFNETLAAQRAFQFWEAPHLHRRDGSYTNW